MKKLFCLTALAAACSARAQSEAMLGFVGTTSSNFTPIYSVQFGPVGWTFTPQTDISVTALGAFAYCLPGTGLEVGLWNSSGTLLASDNITTAGLLIDQSYYQSVTPLELTAGQTYFLGAYSSAGSFQSVAIDPNDGSSDGSATMSPEIQLDQAAYLNSFTFEFPSTTSGSPGSAIVAPNFEFEPVPEPSSLCLLGVGPLVFLARRRRD
jgi:hypothetical protein